MVGSVAGSCDSSARKRGHCHCLPGSHLRSGAISWWLAMVSWVIKGKWAMIVRHKAAQVRYCAVVKGVDSSPIISMPAEKSLHAVRPRQQEMPACHARWESGTNCHTAPFRSITQWAETRNPATSAKRLSAVQSKQPINRSRTGSMANSPGGRLIACNTIRAGSTSCGRASQWGEGCCATSIVTIQPMSELFRSPVVCSLNSYPQSPRQITAISSATVGIWPSA